MPGTATGSRCTPCGPRRCPASICRCRTTPNRTGPTSGSGKHWRLDWATARTAGQLVTGPVTDKSVLPMRASSRPDAARPAVPRRRRRPHRPADRSQGSQPRGGRRRAARSRAGRADSQGRPPARRQLLRNRAAPSLAVHPLLLVDDHDAASRRGSVRRSSFSFPNYVGSPRAWRARRAWRRTTRVCRSVCRTRAATRTLSIASRTCPGTRSPLAGRVAACAQAVAWVGGRRPGCSPAWR